MNATQGLQRAHMGDTVFGLFRFADHVISLQFRRVTGIRMRAL